MTNLEKLLEGVVVEWIKIKNIAEVGTGRSNGNEALEGGEYPFFVRSQTVKNKDTWEYDEEAIVIPGEGGIGDIYHYINGKYAIHQRVYRIHFIKEFVNVKFAFYYFNSCFKSFILEKAFRARVKSIRKPMIEDFFIPVPCPDNPEKSLEIQKEIVRLLDVFTALTTELTTELTVRKKQYNFYREQLLRFEDNEVKWKMLGEIGEYSRTRISSSSIDKSNYVGVDNLLQNRVGKTDSNQVPTEGTWTGYGIGDVLIGHFRPYLKKIWCANNIGGASRDVLVVHITDESVNSRYLYQVLADDKFFAYNMQHAKGAKIPRGNKQKIMEYNIPIPSLEEQARIVSILDKLDTLATSINEGLSKEIQLRKKQYEYYRDLLLTFPKENL